MLRWTLVTLALIGGSNTLKVNGVVRDATGLPLPGALVALSDTGLSALTDAEGRFSIDAPRQASLNLVTSFPGARTDRRVVPAVDQAIAVEIVLEPAPVAETVTVTAAVSPEQPSTFGLSSLQIVQTPGAQADLMRSLQALPGMVRVDEGAGLYVRGGDVSEVLVTLDGIALAHPYRYESPSGGFAGAVDPFLTDGYAFSAGGFSSRYGNVLSGVLDLHGLPPPQARDVTLTAGLAGASLSWAEPVGAHAGLRAAFNLPFPELLFAVNPHPLHYDPYPGGWDATLVLYGHSSRFGLLKVTGMTRREHLGVELARDAFTGVYRSSAEAGHASARWTNRLGQYDLEGAVGYDDHAQSSQVGVLSLESVDQRVPWRLGVERSIAGTRLRWGADGTLMHQRVDGQVPARGGDFEGLAGVDRFAVDYRDSQVGAHTEVESTRGRCTSVFGLRVDHFGQAMATTIDPRIAVSIDGGPFGRLRLAWGLFHQSPDPSFFDRDTGAARLRPMRATHSVIGFETGRADGPAFARLELYRKSYTDLPLESTKDGFSSEGYGSARGMDLFVEAQRGRIHLRLSASLLHAERRWSNIEDRGRYSLPAGTWAPDFSIPYSAQLVANLTLTRALGAGISWRVAAGRPFTPVVGARCAADGCLPAFGPINSERLPRYQRLDLSLSYLVPWGARSVAVFFASIDNAFNHVNVFEYVYSNDYAERRPLDSGSPRTVYVGLTVRR